MIYISNYFVYQDKW